MVTPIIPFPNKKYQIIYADPPWHYKNYANTLESRWVGNKYPTMKISDILNLPIQTIADENCVLFLWTTPPCLLEGLSTINAWGFSYKTKAFCWVKKNKEMGDYFKGMGYWTRSNTEDCLLGVKGKVKRKDASISQIIQNPIGLHSRKPDIVRDLIVKLMGDIPRIELFARFPQNRLFVNKSYDGWDVWGNECI